MTTRHDLNGGLLLPTKCTYSTLAAVGAGGLESSFTQAGPRPGVPVVTDEQNRLRLEHSGGQGAKYHARVIRAGMPSIERGCEVGYRLDTDSGTTDWRGWNPPGVVSEWQPVEASTSGEKHAIATIPSTQEAVLAVYSPGTSTCSARSVSTAGVVSAAGATVAAGTWNWPALVVLPSERVLLLFGDKLHYSDDKGATWSDYSRSPFDGISTGTFSRCTMAYYRGDIIILAEDTTAGTVRQLASSDMGASFELVDSPASWGDSTTVMATPYGLCVSYRKNSDSKPYFFRLESAFETLTEADILETLIADRAIDLHALAIWSDPDGMIWAMYGGSTVPPVGALPGQVVLARSYDAGETWQYVEGRPFASNGSTLAPVRYRVAPQNGAALLAYFLESGGSSGSTLLLATLGGWSNVTAAGGALPYVGLQSRVGSAGRTYNGAWAGGSTWVAVHRPEHDSTWTKTGGSTASTSALVGLTISPTSDTCYYSQDHTHYTDFSRIYCFEMLVSAGGSLTTDVISVLSRIADGSNDYQASLRFTTTGYRLHDVHGGAAVGSDVAIDMTTRLQVLVRHYRGAVEVYHRRSGTTKWTPGPTTTTLTNDTSSPAAAPRIEWGHRVTATATSVWRRFSEAHTAVVNQKLFLLYGPDEIAGRPIGPRPIPVPDIGSTTAAGHFAATAGPARFDDAMTITPEYDYGVSNLHAEQSPSPRQVWRSTDTTEAVFCYDLGLEDWMGEAVGALVVGGNVENYVLEYYDGSSWQTAGTLKLSTGLESLEYTRSGKFIHPNTEATTEADRFLWEHELIGGHALIDGGTISREVTGQSAGLWTTGTSTVRPRVTLEGVTGSEAASGSCDLLAPSGLLVAYVPAMTRWRYWRVRVPASQVVPGDYYEIGQLLVGRIQPWGAECDWLRSSNTKGNFTERASTSGTTYRRERGPAARRWALSWQDQVSLQDIRTGDSPDYLGISGGLPLVAAEDVPQMMRGLFEELKSGEIPCVCIDQLPTATATITDPTRWLYARMGESIAVTTTRGQSGVDEWQRVASIDFDEVV